MKVRWLVAVVAIFTAPLTATTIIVAHGESIDRCPSWSCVRAARPIKYAWAWSAAQVPVRFQDADLKSSDEALEEIIGRAGTRNISIVMSGHGVRLPERLKLMAAPAPMWREVPESELPQRTVASNESIPITATEKEPWRFRVVGKGAGSWWIETKNTAVRIRVVAAVDRKIAIVNENGEALSAAQLAVNDASLNSRDHQTFARYAASRSGMIELPAIPDETNVVLVAFANPYIGELFEGRIVDAPPRLTLKEGARITGKVIDSRRKAIGGVNVRYEGWAGSDARAQLLTGETTTLADGTFALGRVPKGRVLLTFVKSGFAERSVVVKPSSGALNVGVVALVEGRTLRIHVVDSDNKPIEAAAIEWEPGQHSAETDSKGLATLNDLDDATRVVQVGAKGFISRDCELSLKESVVCTLDRAFRVTGRYVAEHSGDSVSLKISEGGRDSYDMVGEDGKFDVDLEPDKSLQLAFLSVSAAPLIVRVQGKSGEVRDLGELRPEAGRVITGRVTRADGEPISGARVWVPRPSAGGFLVSWTTGNMAVANSLDDGSFRLSGLTNEACLVRIDASNAAHTLVHVGAGESGSVQDIGTVAVAEGGTIVVRAGDTTADATAVARPYGAALDFDTVSAPLSEGVAKLHNVHAGTAHVVVVTPMKNVICQGDVDVPDGGSVDFACEGRHVRVSGDVLVGGAPANGGMLLWTPANEATGPGVIVTNRSAGGMISQQVYGVGVGPALVPVDSTGRFATEALDRGEYRVSWSGMEGSLSANEVVNVPDAAAFSVHLAFTAGTIRGTVVDAEGAPAARATVMELASHAATVTNDDGIFELHGTPVGACRVQARRGMQSSTITDVNVQADAPSLTLRLADRRESLRVRVVRPDGAAAAGAFVFASTAAGGPIEVVTADVAGVADVTFSSGIPDRVRFAVSYGNRWSFGDWLTDLRTAEIILHAAANVGSVAVSAKAQSGLLSVRTPDGWDVSALLAMIGYRPVLAPDRPLRIDGLPVGTYLIALNGAVKTATVRPSEVSDLLLP